jgi:hypothetical protein
MENEIVLKNAKIRRNGRHSFVTIPKSYTDNGVINVNEIYEITIRKVGKAEVQV